MYLSTYIDGFLYVLYFILYLYDKFLLDIVVKCLLTLCFKVQKFILYIFFNLQSRQPIFVQLLSAAFRVSQCQWLTFEQRSSVENCIQTLSEVAKSRGIAVPHDLDIQVTNMFTKTAIISRQAAKWIQKRGLNKEISSNSVSNI